MTGLTGGEGDSGGDGEGEGDDGRNECWGEFGRDKGETTEPPELLVPGDTGSVTWVAGGGGTSGL